MKVNKNWHLEFNTSEAFYEIMGLWNAFYNDFTLPHTKDKGEIIAYLYGQNEALKARLNEKEKNKNGK